MMERVFLVHGWSVRETTTYQTLHRKLAEHGFDLHEVYLGRYVSLDNDVEVRDIARAMDRALQKALGRDWASPFHFLTHSTGALVVKLWIARHYTGSRAARKPLRNVVFLAGPHFGSRLAHHGRSMLAQAAYLGDTGRKILTALELGSDFAWEINGAWLDPAVWRSKGIRPFNLIGDCVVRDRFKSRIFPAGYEKGSDMVVRVPSSNLNFRRFRLSAERPALRPSGEINGIPLGVLSGYTHSGPKTGIMNSITSRSTPGNHLALKLILECLKVKTRADYRRASDSLARETRRTRRKRPAFAQLDLRFRDEDGKPVEDFVFKLGAMVDGTRRASKTVVHVHRNRTRADRLTAFLRMKQLAPRYPYFLEVDTRAECGLVSYQPDPFRITANVRQITELIRPDQTTQIEVVLARQPSRNLFVFHHGDDSNLHVRWNRKGEVVRKQLPAK